jgi:hypothetical protein
MYVVRAAFTLQDGTSMTGFLSPPPPAGSGVPRLFKGEGGEMAFLQPTVITSEGHVNFWLGLRRPDDHVLAGRYLMIGKTPVQIFPLGFCSDTQRLDPPVRGEIPGFMHGVEEDGRLVVRIAR